MSYHPDDVVLVFTRQDVREILENSGIDIDEETACRVISRGFDCSPVWEQMYNLLKLAAEDE